MKDFITLLTITLLLVACTDKPPINFVCNNRDINIGKMSVSIQGDKAVFNTVTFNLKCSATGNTNTYGLREGDCTALKTQSGAPYSILSIDEISGEMHTEISAGSLHDTSYFNCKKVQ